MAFQSLRKTPSPLHYSSPLLTVPLPAVTATYAFPFALLNIGLAAQCLHGRYLTKTYLGQEGAIYKDKPRSTYKGNPTKAPADSFDPLLVATRAHANFNENVPLALIFAGAVELCGGTKTTLAYVLGGLVVARINHALGLRWNVQPMRATGFTGTALIQLVLGGWGTMLGLKAQGLM